MDKSLLIKDRTTVAKIIRAENLPVKFDAAKQGSKGRVELKVDGGKAVLVGLRRRDEKELKNDENISSYNVQRICVNGEYRTGTPKKEAKAEK